MPDVFAIVILAPLGEPDANKLRDALNVRLKSLATVGDTVMFADEHDVAGIPAKAITVGVYFGSAQPTSSQAAAIATCLARNMTFFPVVADLTQFAQVVPPALLPYNGFQLPPNTDPNELAGLMLESLGLQRGRRKIFISYARADASAMTAQLREAFTGRWYSAFHDIVSIRPGRDFQGELLQELTDSDVFLLLNSPGVATRPYVQEEIGFAMRAGLGGVQLVWPDVKPRRDALFTVIDLAASTTRPSRLAPDGRLTTMAIDEVLMAVARERTAIQQQREAEVEGAICAYAAQHGLKVAAHMGRFFQLTGPGGVTRVEVALGLPTSLELARDWTSIAFGVQRHVVYDPLGITSTMADHLAFLAEKFPLRLLSMRDSLTWPTLT